MTVSVPSTAKASRFFTPIAGVLPSGIVTTNAYDNSVGTYSNITTVYWNSGQLNTQGQQWEAANVADVTAGVRNTATPRTNPGDNNNHFYHVTEFEFIFTGTQFEVQCIGTTSYDMQVYVEWGGQMWRVQTEPLAGTTPGTVYRRIAFASPYHGRIRVHMGGSVFIGIVTEQSAIIKPSPDRLFGICDGDSWADGLGFKQASGKSYWSAGLCDFLFERTGIVWARRAQGGTGFFNNGTTTVTDDTADSTNSTRFFSTSRKGWLTGAGPSGVSDFSDKPLFYLLNGTWNDGSRSGATGSVSGPMATRALSCYQWIRAQDPWCTIAHVSPQPYNGGGAAGAENGPPTAGSAHDLNRQEQQAAIARVAKAVYINSFGPTAPWWTGTGGAGSPATSQQANLLGPDGVHPAYLGYDFYAGMIAAELGQTRVPVARARRQV